MTQPKFLFLVLAINSFVFVVVVVAPLRNEELLMLELVLVEVEHFIRETVLRWLQTLTFIAPRNKQFYPNAFCTRKKNNIFSPRDARVYPKSKIAAVFFEHN